MGVISMSSYQIQQDDAGFLIANRKGEELGDYTEYGSTASAADGVRLMVTEIVHGPGSPVRVYILTPGIPGYVTEILQPVSTVFDFGDIEGEDDLEDEDEPGDDEPEDEDGEDADDESEDDLEDEPEDEDEPGPPAA